MRVKPAAVLAAAIAAALQACSPPPGGPGALSAGSELVDSLGRRVRVPAKVERVISLEPEATRIIVALGAGDKLAGIDYFLRHHDHVFPLVFPASRSLPVVSNQGQDLNYEAALRLRPDLVIVSPSEFGSAEAVERKMGVPVVALASMGRFQDLFAEIGTLGRLLGREDRAAGLTAYLKERLDEAAKGASPGGTDARPSVYLSFWGSLVRTPVSYEPVDAAGGRNVAAGLLPERLGTAALTVSLEKLFAWDPDIILVHGNYLPSERRVTVEGVLGDPRLGSLRAVREGRVHYTFGFWYWWDPALVLIETLYLARLFGSGTVAAEDFRRLGNGIYLDVYGVEGAFDAVCRALECHEWTKR